jgi:hypothetical protein
MAIHRPALRQRPVDRPHFPVIAAAGVARVVLGAQDGAHAAAEDFGGSFEIRSRRLDLGRNASVNVQQGRVENGHRSDDDDQDQLVAVKPVRQHTCHQIHFNSFISNQLIEIK